MRSILIDSNQVEQDKNCDLSSPIAPPRYTSYPDQNSRRAGLTTPYGPSGPGVPAQADMQGELASPSTPSLAAVYPDTLPIMMSGGQAANPCCGEVVAIKVCENQDHPTRFVRHSCGRSGCKTCWPVWAKRASSRAADRLRGYLDASKTQYVPWHISLSPPAGLLESQVSMQKLLDLAHDQSKILGITSVLVIAHGYRIRDKYRGVVNRGAKEAGMNRYRWCMAQPDPRKYLYWSPHFHLMGWGYLMDADQYHKGTGWIYKKHKTRPLEHIQKTIYYLLSHAWQFGPGKNTYRYWAGLSPTKMTVQESITWEIERCSVCKGPIKRVPLTTPDDLGDRAWIYQDVKNAPVSKIKVISRTYWIKKKRRLTAVHSSPQISTWLDEDQDEDQDPGGSGGAVPECEGGLWPEWPGPPLPGLPAPPPNDGLSSVPEGKRPKIV